MDTALLIVRLLLAAVFLVAGGAKLLDLPGSRQAAAGFGVPPALAGPVGLLLPLAELAVAVALLPAASAKYGAIGALILLLAFLAGIGINLARGNRPDCHCFGQLHSEPIGWPTLARNGVLAVLAGFVVVAGHTHPGPSAVAWIGALRTAEQVGLALAVVAFALILFLLWFLLHLLQQNGRLLARVEALEGGSPLVDRAAPAYGLPVGAPAPSFALEDVHGETVTLETLVARGFPVLLVFTSPDCASCAALLPDVARWQREGADRLTIVLITTGSTELNRTKAADHGLQAMLVQRENEVAGAYQSPGTPSAVVVTTDGRIGEPMAAGIGPVRGLVQRQLDVLLRPPNAPSPLHIGAPAPDFTLPDLAGREVTPADLRGHETVLLFWNTGCGFCRKMLPDLKSWEAARPAGAPGIVLFSAGPVDEIRSMGLRSPVLLDPDFSYGPRFGANGTPMAVLLDADARVASGVAAGADAVLALARGEKPVAGRDLVVLQPEVPRRDGNGSGQDGDSIGAAAPDFTLPDLDGRKVTLADFRGQPTLLLFWNADCRFCQQMLPDLKAWERSRPRGAPQILVISSGSREDLRAMGLRSPVLLDPDFETGPSYGARGTPMGVLVDAQGRITSPLAAGAPEVLALLRGEDAALPSPR